MYAGIPLSLMSFKLLKWRDEEGCAQNFQLVDGVSAKWRDFGILLGLDVNQLDGFDSQYRGNPTSCWNRVMEHWLAGEGGCDYLPTWEGLYTLLNDADFSSVAAELEKAVTGRSFNKIVKSTQN